MDDRQLRQPSQLFETLFELYNLASVIQSDQSRIEGARSCIPKLRAEIMKNFEDTFKGYNDDDLYDIYEVSEAFAEAGYTLEPNGEDENGWAPLNEVKATKHLASVDLS